LRDMKYKRMVAKFGTNLLTGGTDSLDISLISNIAEQIALLHGKGQETIIVSSGAVAAGRQKMGSEKKHKGVPFKQVLAAIGQNRLMQTYERIFEKYNIQVAQALLTKNDLSNRSGYLNARNTLLSLLELGVICIVNENDVVATDEIGGARFGDNDNLSALVANLVDADVLAILTDIDGLYTADPLRDPDARLIPEVEKIDARIQRLASKTTSSRGVGGMVTKIEAAKLATACGITVIIAGGRNPDVLQRINSGENPGTIFLPHTSKLESKKRWIISGVASRGRLFLDEGAAIALQKHNRSLLPAGITGLEGRFQRGDVVEIADGNGNQIGCGMTNYSSKELAVIKGAHSTSISDILGYEYGEEAVHRNNMVLLS
jgi:glutamate 5-kinase